MERWQVHTLDDGRTVEYVDARWGTTLPDDPPGTVPVDVDVLLDSEPRCVRVLMTADDLANCGYGE